ncbi:MAG: hypothetical protein HY280_05440 [Nitrospinae bacterium]|nr:hypothetical protein [Nitrospinota bacterium]
MKKFAVLLAFFAVIAGGLAFAQENPLWGKYKSAFIADNGRVEDFGQNRISHSEGQGYGMLLAVANNDRPVFDKIWMWTRDNMGARKDGLFAWQWGNRENGDWGPIDFNNATDGDVLISFALLKAHKKWGAEEYKTAALPVIKAVRTKLAVKRWGYTFLLPGYSGFGKDGGTMLNPSYFLFSAYRLFAMFEDKDFWEAVNRDSMKILYKCHFGRFGLPADWIIFSDGNVSPRDGWGGRYGFDAVRIFYLLSVENDQSFKDALGKMLDYYEKAGYIPEWADFKYDSVSLSPASAGFYSLYATAANKIGKTELAKKLSAEATKKLPTEKDNYYSFSLYLIAATDALN